MHDEISGLVGHAVVHVLPMRGEVPPSMVQTGSSGTHCWMVFAAYSGPMVIGGALIPFKNLLDGSPKSATAATWLATSGGIGPVMPGGSATTSRTQSLSQSQYYCAA